MNKDFIFGMFVGGSIMTLITWKLLKNKYEKIANEEIESVIETFKNRKDTIVHKDITNDINNEKEIYENKINDLGYMTDNDSEYCVDANDRDKEFVQPYVISPEEFGEIEDYDTMSLICYEDMVVTNDKDEIIDDIDNLLGDALDHFGDYEDDAVHVRNENEKCDYEILKSEKLFSEIIKEDTINDIQK